MPSLTRSNPAQMQQYLSHRQSRSGLSHWEQTTVLVGLISQNISDPEPNLKPDFPGRTLSHTGQQARLAPLP
jgi:hypothetical protein